LDNASSIKALVNNHNNILYAVPYQHFTNSIEKYKNIFKGAYERPEKYVTKNKTRKVKKNYL